MSDATIVSDLTVSEDDVEILSEDVSRDVSKDLINVSKDMTKERLKFPSQEQQQQNMTDDIMSDSEKMDEVGLVAELQDTINTLHSEYLAWRKSRQNSIKEINAMADSLDGHQRNVDIAKVTGTSVGAAATVAGIVFTSLALAPFTAGSSLFIGLGIGAGVVGGAGVGTGIGAVVTKKILEREKWETLQQIVTEDQKVTDKLRMIIERYNHVLTSVTNLVKEKEELGTARTILSAVRGTHTLAEKITVSILKDVIKSAAGVTTNAVEGGAKAALVVGRVLGGIGIALGGIALVIDIIYLVQVGRNIHSGSKCDIAKRLRSFSKILEDEMKKIDDVLAFDLAMSGSRSPAEISRSAIYDIHELGEDDLEFDEKTFGKLHIDNSSSGNEAEVHPDSKNGRERKLCRRPDQFVDEAIVEEERKKQRERRPRTRDERGFQNRDLPAFWNLSTTNESDSFQLVPIGKTGQTFHEYEKIETQFFESMGRDNYRINKIQRIQNADLYRGFQLYVCLLAIYKNRMAKRASSDAVEEKFLFHGTKEEYIDAICLQGFDFRVSGTSTGSLYGHGSYFAKDAFYSRNYTDSCQVFVARVLIGHYTKGESHYKRPPPKDPNKPLEEVFDSCVDDVKNPRIFVLFAIEQAYPEYLIDYQKI